jgi:hypothetical protein
LNISTAGIPADAGHHPMTAAEKFFRQEQREIRKSGGTEKCQVKHRKSMRK